jgi:hypothetical protein
MGTIVIILLAVSAFIHIAAEIVCCRPVKR